MNNSSVVGRRRSPSYDRLIGVFSPPSYDTEFSSSANGDELNEDDVFYTSDFSEGQHSPSPVVTLRLRYRENSGILAALAEGQSNFGSQVIHRKPNIPSSSTTPLSRAIPSIPKPHSSLDVKHSQSLPARRFQQSAPVNVPMMPRKPRNGEVLDVGDEMDADNMLPPHEIVDRVSSQNQKNNFSVLEGAGRTLKGRDLRQVRNAVWRQTGFLD